jgi:hypothetical protein
MGTARSALFSLCFSLLLGSGTVLAQDTLRHLGIAPRTHAPAATAPRALRDTARAPSLPLRESAPPKARAADRWRAR